MWLRLGMLLCLAGAPACSDEATFVVRDDEVCFERRDGVRICIDMYEASREDATGTAQGLSEAPPRSLPGRIPWTNIRWSAAREACRAREKRLCQRDEWIDACDGAVGEDVGLRYPYGEERDPTLCNVASLMTVPGGQAPDCRSPLGTFDQAGNVWEWTGDAPAAAVARGGGYRSTQTHECRSGDDFQRFPPETPNEEVGFRCCRDA